MPVVTCKICEERYRLISNVPKNWVCDECIEAGTKRGACARCGEEYFSTPGSPHYDDPDWICTDCLREEVLNV